ncbi:MAG TPA: hypothetical protein PK159_10755, partial [Steroidobacteraceae bacterium]|nr:hypothetical protein [Steroidobacteraceae bacterium]
TAADAMGLTADRLAKLGLVDAVLPEPLGGAHRGPAEIAQRLKETLLDQLAELEGVSPDDLRAARNARIAGFGEFSEAAG